MDWKYVDVRIKNGKDKEMKMGSKLEENKIKEYSDLVDEFNDIFAWSYDEFRGIPCQMVEQCIPLIPCARQLGTKRGG